MAATTNGSGANRVAPKKYTANNPSTTSIDDDQTQVPGQVVAFTVQSMIVNNASTKNPYQMIV